MISAYLYAFILSIVHFLGEELDKWTSSHELRVISFTTGITVTYVFLHLLPQFHQLTLNAADSIFIFPLIGFSSFYLAEQYVEKTRTGDKIWEDYKEIHSTFFFVYHTALGMLVAYFLTEPELSSTLFFLPILLHTGVSSFSLSELNEDIVDNIFIKIIISGAPLLGVFLYRSSLVYPSNFLAIFGAVTGMFFYIAISDGLPEDSDTCLYSYMIGTLLYLGITALTWV